MGTLVHTSKPDKGLAQLQLNNRRKQRNTTKVKNKKHHKENRKTTI